jgi:hypothetical protein
LDVTDKTRFCPGDIVEVRSFQEIAETLDSNGCLDALPFMPEMKGFCGKQYAVFRRLEKTCVEGLGMRQLPDTVTLKESYCDGSFHDGCQKCCPLLWKDAWLKPAAVAAASGFEEQGASSVSLRTKKDSTRYFCQSTELRNATAHLSIFSLKRCTSEYRSKNVGFVDAVRYLWVPLIVQIKIRLWGISSVLPVGTCDPTPVEVLDLQPGELVEVKGPEEISLTLNRKGRNRGMRFVTQMLPFCGKRLTVKSRVERIILEKTSEMRLLKHTVLLENAVCDGHTILGGCSRLLYILWREAWLRRVGQGRPH